MKLKDIFVRRYSTLSAITSRLGRLRLLRELHMQRYQTYTLEPGGNLDGKTSLHAIVLGRVPCAGICRCGGLRVPFRYIVPY